MMKMHFEFDWTGVFENDLQSDEYEEQKISTLSGLLVDLDDVADDF
jgi:hypothetical protein